MAQFSSWALRLVLVLEDGAVVVYRETIMSNLSCYSDVMNLDSATPTIISQRPVPVRERVG